MKKIFFMILIGFFCLGAITTWAGTAHKMIDKDYGVLYGDKAIIQLLKIVQESLKKDSSGTTPFPKTESFYGSAPVYLYTAFKKAGHYKGELSGFPDYLGTLVPAYDFDRSRVYSLSRFIRKNDGKKIVDFGFKRKIDRNGGKEIAFADPKTGNLVITGNCMNVILDGEKVLETGKEESALSPSTQNGWLCGCERVEKPLKGPLRLRSNYENETIVLTQPRQKKIILFWLEDAEGKKVYIPSSKINFTDINKEGKSEVNYPVLFFDPNTCSVVWVKWWDRIGGPLRGELHKAENVLLDSGLITVSVDGVENILRIQWKVLYSKLYEERKIVEVKSLKISFENKVLVGDLGSLIFVHDRLIEITPFGSQKSWRTVAREGKFEVKDIPSGEYLIQVFHFPEDSNKGTLKPQIEFEEILSF